MNKKLLFLAFLVTTIPFVNNLFAQTVDPFSLRFQTSAKGSIDFVSNASIECDGTGTGGANCVDLAAQLPPTFAAWSQNNDHNARYIDIDGNPSTFSSTSDSLNLPLCSEVLYAAIYWGGRSDNGDPGFANRGNIKIKTAGGSYVDVTASETIDATIGNRVYYCFADITDYIKSNPTKSMYTVGNVYGRLGGSNMWAGWNIVVVYKNDLLPMRNLNVFDGLVNVNNTGTNVEVGITDFLTPPAGPVTFEVGVYGYDGDRGFLGDSLLFDGGSGYVAISNGLNPIDDIFNFSQSRNGVVSTSQIPLIHNNISIDADLFAPNNAGFPYIGNSDTEANVKITTSNETVMVQVITLAIDVYEPDMRAGVRVEDINGGVVEPGDILEYTVVGSNIGSDPATNSYIVDTLAPNITFVPGSIEIIHGPNLGVKTDGAGDDQGTYLAGPRVVRVNIGTGASGASGGVVLNSPSGVDSTVFTFRATAIDDCVSLSCDNVVENQAFIFGTGTVSGNEISNISNPGVLDVDGCPVIGTTSVTIDISDCSLPPDTTVAGYCSGVLFSSFPYDELGYTYYNASFVVVPAAVGPGTYYAIRTPFAGCSDTIVITVTTFFAPPTTSNAGPDQTRCISPGTATLAGNNPLVGTGLWTVVSGGATVTTPTAFNSGVTGLTPGVNTFRWSITNGASCPPSTDLITITVNPLPTTANAGADQTRCISPGTATLAGNNPVVGTGTWTVIAGGATVTSPTLFNSGVTGLTVGVNTFRWTIANSPCTSSFDDVTITVTALPTTANAGPDQSRCASPGTATLAGNNPLVGTGAWTVITGGATVTSPTLFNSGVTGLTVGVNTFRWTITSGPCTASFDDITINVTAGPTTSNAGPDQTRCISPGTATFAGNNPLVGTGAWTVIAGGATVTSPTLFNSGVTGLTVGVNTFRWTISSGSCTPSFDDVTITVSALPTTANAGPDQSRCASPGTATLAGNNPLVGTGAWTVITGGATVTSPTLFNSGVTGLTVGVNTFRWTITSGPCTASFDDITINVTAGPTTSNAGPDQTACVSPGTATLAGNNPLVGTGAWTVIAGGATVTSPTLFNSGVTGLTVGTNTFRWTISSGSCTPSFDDVTITVSALPTTANAGVDQTVCLSPGTATLAGNNPVIGTGAWTVITGGATVTSPTLFNSGVTGLTVGVNTFRWSITNGPCAASFDDVIINVSEPPSTAAAGPDQLLCLVTSTTLAGNNPLVGTGLWTVITGGGTVTTPTLFNSGVTGLTPGINTFRWTISTPGCPPSFDDVVISFDPDSDGDGICDEDDLDDDNDGIPDLEEGVADTDGDGVIDALDLDSDNDGIPDIIEAGGDDTDGDGRVDGFEDVDGDGLDDGIAVDPLDNPDSDGDGIVDAHDLDSDNDGTPDVIEAGGTDVDGDGILDGIVDADGDGFADSVDTDNDLTPGAGDGGVALENLDTDGDGVDDRLDLDSDNDGIPDVTENGGTDVDGDGVLDGYTDVDGDGFADSVDTDDNTVPGPGDGGTSLPTGDADLDGVPNYLDLDSDNDGILDLVEAGGTDVDGNGRIDDFADVDGDGFADAVDTDDNTTPGTGDGGTSLEMPNTDGTGGADYLDIDADGDGIVDNLEGQPSDDYTAATGTDADGDGIDDAYDVDAGGSPIGDYDHDGDGAPDYVDLDADNDGEGDAIEGHDLDGDGVADTVPTGTDSDNDGLDDAFDTIILTPGTAFTNAGNGTVDPLTDGDLADADSPGVGDLDFRENDSDGDGIDDAVDLDDDNDGIPDLEEGVADTDGDGVIDALDLDSDNDGIPDIIEAGGDDTDGDGRVDGFEDVDGDGLDDGIAVDPLDNPDSDGDGIVDAHDLDSDNDGTPDVIEAGGTDVDGDGILDGIVDADGDGFADSVDTDNDLTPGAGDGGVALENLDTDGDGVDDRLDLDSDNDGIPDVTENGGTDVDGDGVLDGYTDVDGDGFADSVDTDDNTVPGPGDGGTSLPTGDADLDGVPNYLDLDSDNDGILDLVEAGGTDVDGNGRIDDFADVDGDGFADAVDTDDNTIPGTGDGGISLEIPNTDGTGGADYLDIDADGDGIVDNLEGQPSDDYTAATGTDADGDGIDDAYDVDAGGSPIGDYDHDGDGDPDYVDLDADNDGEGDAIEGHDLDGDGVADTVPTGTDSDNDGLDDAFDTIILTPGTAFTNAGNGIVDPLTDGTFGDADAPGIGDLDFRETDYDHDGIPDVADLDDDNDGIPDLVEDLDADGDNDPTTNPTDTDGDGIPDMFDLDSDNDGIADIVEAGGVDDNGDGRVDAINPDGTLINDTDNDGLDDLYDGDNGGTDIPNPDTDGDGHADFQDVDSDNDGIYDIVEDGGVDTDNDGRVDDWLDSDGDTIPDYADVDATGGIDLDGDGIDDSLQIGDDEDGDGIADEFDEDANGDGWDDDDATDGSEDTDGDGVEDRLDLDSDNDGTPDIIEDGGVDENGDGRIDDFVDEDGDGADDEDMTDGLDDFDGDGVPDHEDLDSDNDGITDAEENGVPDEDGDGRIDDFNDEDGDGWDDDNQTTDPVDTDGDGQPDHTDLDADNDGIDDIIEGGGEDENGDGVIDDFTDENGDGLDDTNGGVNPPDSDGDGIDDYQDTDSDNDGVTDEKENDPNGDGSGPDDTDGDGIDDYIDTDDDNDGILTEDESDKDEQGNYTDCDNDGIPDYLDPDPCDLLIPSGFSPDNDGINDKFIIKGIEAYPNASLTIFNRWGNKVYESTGGYPNDWDGTNQFGMTVGERNLPVGTYFYVLDLGDGSEVIKGFVFINK